MFGLFAITVLTLSAQSPVAPAPSEPRLSLASAFGEHMVLQAEQPVRLWGTAPPNIRVHIALGPTGQPSETIAAVHVNARADGSWQAELPAQPASFERYSIEILANSQMVRFNDVLFGEVWIAAGQSNMEWPLDRSLAWQDLLTRMQGNSLVTRNLEAVRCYQAEYTATGAGGSWDHATVDGLDPKHFQRGSWSLSTSKSIASMSAVAWYFGEQLLTHLDRPIGLIDVAAGGTPTEAWVSRAALASDPKTSELVRAGNWLDNDLLGGWCRERAGQNLRLAIEEGWKVPHDETGPHHAFQPGFMWQTAVAPFARLSVRGVLWYQGESNAGSAARVAQHEAIFRRLVDSWREAWGRPALPFLFVQLPAMNRADWPAFREQQRQLDLTIDHTGMAVSLDLGDPNDVHPRRKQAVGERLARLARHQVYGQTCLHSGPRLLRAGHDNAGLWLEFTAVGRGLAEASYDQASGFEWQDQEGRWHAASLRQPIPSPGTASGDAGPSSQRLWLSPVGAAPEPGMQTALALRYAWAPAASAAIFDSDGLPASPFLIELGQAESTGD